MTRIFAALSAILCGVSVYVFLGGYLSAALPSRAQCDARYPKGLVVTDLADRSPDGLVAGVNYRGPTDEETELATRFNNNLNSSKDFQRKIQKEVYSRLDPTYQKWMEKHWAQEDVARYAITGAEPYALPSRSLTNQEKRDLCFGAVAYAEIEVGLRHANERRIEAENWSQ
jgi:hypothetical protein